MKVTEHIEKAKGKTILITTHIMSFVEDIAEDVVFLLEGKIHFQGSLEKLKKQYQETTVERAIAAILQKDKTPKPLNGNALSKSQAVLTQDSNRICECVCHICLYESCLVSIK